MPQTGWCWVGLPKAIGRLLFFLSFSCGVVIGILQE